jgi:glutamine synthetase
MVVRNEPHPDHELFDGQCRKHRARAALEELDKDRESLKAGGVLDDDFIDAYIDLKMTEVIRFEHTPHPVEFDMYYSA